jgi:prevent-host-death family protein
MQLTVYEAKNQLSELLKAASKGEQVIIQNNEGQDFQIIYLAPTVKHLQYGSAKGIVKMLENFDDPIEEFENYMP